MPLQSCLRQGACINLICLLQVPLEALSSELEAHLQVLRNRLVEVINEHYGDFVSLSSKLVNVDSAVIRMQKPLMEIKVPLAPTTASPIKCLSSPVVN